MKIGPSHFNEKITPKLRDGRVMAFECEHEEEGEDAVGKFKTLVTSIQKVTLPLSVDPYGIRVTPIPDSNSADVVIAKPNVEEDQGEVHIPIG